MVDFPWFSIVMLVYQRVRTLKMLPTWEVLVVSPRHLMKLYRDCRLQDLRLEWKTWGMLGCNWGYKWIPPGKLTKNYGKSQLLMGKSTINGPFSIAMFVYQTVVTILNQDGGWTIMSRGRWFRWLVEQVLNHSGWPISTLSWFDTHDSFCCEPLKVSAETSNGNVPKKNSEL